MGKHGPQRTPTEILKKRGSWLAKVRENEPSVDVWDSPEFPKWLSDPPKYDEFDIQVVAEEIFVSLVPQLHAMGILGTIDEKELVKYCLLEAQWRKTELFLMENGMSYVYTDRNGNKSYKAYPEAALANQLASQLLRLADRFGMNPASRSSIKVPEKPKGEVVDKSRFFKKARS